MKKLLSLILGLFPIALMAGKQNSEPIKANDPEPSYLTFQEKIEPIVEAKKTVVKKTFDERLKDKVVAMNVAEEQRKLERGAKEFMYGGKTIIARDEKNALRKAKNLGLI